MKYDEMDGVVVFFSQEKQNLVIFVAMTCLHVFLDISGCLGECQWSDLLVVICGHIS